MKIRTWETRDIWFKITERKAATRIVKRMLKAGWEFQVGWFDDDGLVEGGDSVKTSWLDGEPTEEVQLYRIKI